ncbi:helix-turn-helix domain-containing protein [Erwinia sp. BNK-24-b]|uniref:helix-turn-helix domain-containing protein n=1 Tax=Erwinia TaxID=551 RepID=UPI001FED98B5|nr:type II toxin-antitoxin system MqsA family antitoxin [Erwinia phyllosphaerae]MBV4365679.1 type II toxin-antitoxin system MqsA family antitoxin [Erwinia phyllosphaerae]
MKKRQLFTELVEGMDAWGEMNAGKKTLKTHRLSIERDIAMPASELRQIRESLQLSQGLFAQYLHTGLTTYQNWEQGRARPNNQAILLIKMVEKDPALLQKLASLSR